MKEIRSNEEKNKQIIKETKVSLLLYLLYFLWWYFTGYGLSKGNPENYTYILGLPLWFFLSSIVGYVLFVIAIIVVTRLFFKNFNLEDEEL
ncbi:YhdT family protein [Anaerosphaera multitolerans]|uniref:DUF997 family protein n=1 Tax=Anaerosphaera multitolerans TaxID=2487351 RepID=A0A437S7B1_9FIRM|nr:YhdT family protein [Anaerosphaera multitolerans]RVU54882.1 DUF997 family protein [Anaerosphaera multitolerans]